MSPLDGESRGGRPSWPLGMLGALALMLAVESSVAWHEVDFTSPQRLEWCQSREAAGREAPGCSILSLGTSLTKFGVYSPVVERESGRRTYNLATCAGRLPGSYYLIRRAVDAGARPEAVLLEVHPGYLGTSFRKGFAPWPDLLGPLEALDLAWSAGDASFFLSTSLRRLVPTLRGRAEIRAAILALARGEYSSPLPNTMAYRRNLEANSGAFVHRRPTPYRGEAMPAIEARYVDPGGRVDPVNESYLRRLLDLCRSRGIGVYWLIPPLCPELQARREQLGLDAIYDRFVERYRRAYPDLVVLDGRRSGYPTRFFQDPAHLDFEGAAAFSGDVGRALRATLDSTPGPDRWVRLPPHRDRPIEAPLEPMTRSVQIINESGILKR